MQTSTIENTCIKTKKKKDGFLFKLKIDFETNLFYFIACILAVYGLYEYFANTQNWYSYFIYAAGMATVAFYFERKQKDKECKNQEFYG